MKFDSVQEAAAFMLDNQADEQGCFEAWDYILANLDPESLTNLYAGFKQVFPNLQATHYDDNGTPYFDIDTVKKMSGLSEDEIFAITPEEDITDSRKQRLHNIQ